MGFKLGIIGLPNVGKSTLFNALSNAKAEVSNYPFTTIAPNTGIVEVPDGRTAKIAQIMNSPKAIGTIIEFVDIAGLVKGASKGEGLGNQFLANIREVDAIAHVVRAFKEENIVHVEGSADPKRDLEIINSELLLADLATVEKNLAAARTAAKAQDKKAVKTISALEHLKEGIGRGDFAVNIDLKEDEKETASELCLLTLKPQLIVINTGENAMFDGNMGSTTIAVCAKLESEIKDLSAEEAEQYLKEAGIAERGLLKLIKAGYDLLGLITFFTSNEKETRAWTVKKNTRAPVAAGKIHSDMEKGFISAEVVSFDDLVKAGSYHKAKETGQVRLEGKNYEIKDGDIVYFRFNV